MALWCSLFLLVVGSLGFQIKLPLLWAILTALLASLHRYKHIPSLTRSIKLNRTPVFFLLGHVAISLVATCRSGYFYASFLGFANLLFCGFFSWSACVPRDVPLKLSQLYW